MLCKTALKIVQSFLQYTSICVLGRKYQNLIIEYSYFDLEALFTLRFIAKIIFVACNIMLE